MKINHLEKINHNSFSLMKILKIIYFFQKIIITMQNFTILIQLMHCHKSLQLNKNKLLIIFITIQISSAKIVLIISSRV